MAQTRIKISGFITVDDEMLDPTTEDGLNGAGWDYVSDEYSWIIDLEVEAF